MSTSPDAAEAGSRLARRLRVDLLWRLALVVTAAVCALASVPAVMSGTLLLAGVVLVIERLAQLRRRGGLDTLLVTVGGALVALVLVGLGLGATPIGLRAATWTVALTALSVAGLVVAALAARPDPTTPTRAGLTKVLKVTPWLVAGGVVVGLAVTVSTRSVEATESLPVEMSIGRVDGTQVQVVVSASEKVGPLELRTTGTGSEISYPLITPEPGAATTTTLAVPESGRATVTLSYPDQTQPLRTLILAR